jgi:nitric oxide reductase subunit B
METGGNTYERISRRWAWGAVATMIIGFSVLIWIGILAYREAPPIPKLVVTNDGQRIFTGDDIRAGQQVFLKYGLMENGSIWGHGAYLGPDFSADYLHGLALDARHLLARDFYGKKPEMLSALETETVHTAVPPMLKDNWYDNSTDTLVFKEAEAVSYQRQIGRWTGYFSEPAANGGLRADYITDHGELRQLTAFFAWTAWASVVARPGKPYSYTNNFPYDPLAGNNLTSESILWSALSLITLLAGTALVLFAFGRFDYLGWKGRKSPVHPAMLPGVASAGQRATIKFFVVVAILFLLQVLVGGAVGHYRADPGTFYGIDLARFLPSNILRTWHLQLAIFWIATSYVAGGLLLSQSVGRKEPARQVRGVNILFGLLVLVALGSLLGELLGINQRLGELWFWFGHQGWEYLDIGRGWQFLLAAALLYWVFLIFRALTPALRDPERREISWLFGLAALAIPFFYLPAFFFGSTTDYTMADNWRFWIIHLWVEGFFELFVTTMVAVTFFRLGVVSKLTATRVIYLDAILFLGAGIIGTGHHWYWTGQSTVNLALSSLFSAMEVVPLTLLTLDAWSFIKLTRGECDECGKTLAIPHKWTFYFLMAVGFWNFVGAGIFGFLINMPVVSYFEVGTMLTPNHGHTALMGVFGMEGIALMVMTFRQVLDDFHWQRIEKYIRLSFWGLNAGLLLMAAGNLFPGGVMQFYDVLNNGYWHARGLDYLNRDLVRFVEWARMPGDLVFIVLGVIPLTIAAFRAYLNMKAQPAPLESAD